MVKRKGSGGERKGWESARKEEARGLEATLIRGQRNRSKLRTYSLS